MIGHDLSLLINIINHISTKMSTFTFRPQGNLLPLPSICIPGTHKRFTIPFLVF